MIYADFLTITSDIINNRYDEEIYDWNVIKNTINHIIVNNYDGYGSNIVDFIDRGCWDRIIDLQFNDTNRQIEMKWRNGWLYHASVESIIVIHYKEMFFVLVKAFYQDTKTLNRLYSPGSRSFSISTFGEYMTEVRRLTRSGEDFIQIPNINCYTTCIMTRPLAGVPTSNHTSEHIMHSINLNLAKNKFEILKNAIEEIYEYDRDLLQEKGNTARRYFEYILMLINIRSGISFDKPYQDQMLGNLTPVLRLLDLSPEDERRITLAQEVLNACSHHGGVRIKKERLIDSLDALITLCDIIKVTDFFEISTNTYSSKLK
ncbi:TPA: hypothetical protein OXC77_003980 [Enterobacter roggenkampii]|uniref:hypothetical protein n=1 Tax=Enterobacter roggenkampii TaxID=1812935 RepID=UPI0022A55293|nr:hypothetical protein [Enterobacter roggenkampii]